MPELPNWVYDLVMDLQHQQETHPELMFQAGGMPAPAKYDWCPCAALDKVPDAVQSHAAAIAAYRRKAENDGEPEPVATGATPERLFASDIRQAREVRGWSQERLAQELTDRGVRLHATGITRIEGGQRAVRLNEAHALAGLLGLQLPEVATDA